MKFYKQFVRQFKAFILSEISSPSFRVLLTFSVRLFFFFFLEELHLKEGGLLFILVKQKKKLNHYCRHTKVKNVNKWTLISFRFSTYTNRTDWTVDETPAWQGRPPNCSLWTWLFPRCRRVFDFAAGADSAIGCWHHCCYYCYRND